VHEVNREVLRAEMLRLLLGRYRLKEIAKIQKLSYSTVRKYANDPQLMEELKALSNDIYQELDRELKMSNESFNDRIAEASGRALEKLIELIESPSEGIALKASTSLLDRNPETSRMNKIEAEHHLTIDPMLLVHAAAKAREVDEYDEKQKVRELKELPVATNVQ